MNAWERVLMWACLIFAVVHAVWFLIGGDRFDDLLFVMLYLTVACLLPKQVTE